MGLQFPGMRFTKLLHGLENFFLQHSQSGCLPRLQQLPDAAREKAVRVKDVFFDVEIRISILQLPGSIGFYAMTKDQVLRTSGGSNRIRLNEAHAFKSSLQCCGLE
jgi:hypothetical protein